MAMREKNNSSKILIVYKKQKFKKIDTLFLFCFTYKHQKRHPSHSPPPQKPKTIPLCFVGESLPKFPNWQLFPPSLKDGRYFISWLMKDRPIHHPSQKQMVKKMQKWRRFVVENETL